MGVNGSSAKGDLGHLLPEVAVLIDRPVEGRIWFVRQDKWIGYARADEVLAAMRDLMDQPQQRRRRGMLVAGRAKNGKSTLLAQFLDEHPVTTREGGEADCPVVAMEMPAKADESQFWSSLLVALKIPHRDNDPASRKRAQALDVLTRIRCRVVLIDEVHNVLPGHALQQRQLLAVMKASSTTSGCPWWWPARPTPSGP